MISKTTSIIFALLFHSVVNGYEACWHLAAERYEIPVIVLKAVAHVESRHNPLAVRKNNNGSTDFGLMQVNTRWLPYLKRYGITVEEIKIPCVNIMVGAWVLKQEINRFGFNWRAIGAYHVGSYTKKTRVNKLKRYVTYSAKVYRYIKNHHR